MGSRFEDLYLFLQSKGFEAFAPGTKKGQCEKPYLVVKPTEGVKVLSLSSTKRYYDIMCFSKTVSGAEQLKEQVREAMKSIYPLFNPTSNETQPFFDDGVKGWMTSIEYVNYRKIEHF